MLLKRLVNRFLIVGANNFLSLFNLQLSPLGKGYRDVKSTLKNASRLSLTINEYLESLGNDAFSIGYRDKVMNWILTQTSYVSSALEIGSGTMRYGEVILSRKNLVRYEIYETRSDWRKFTRKNFSSASHELIVHTPNGRDLHQTSSTSVDLVHAHGVFVYLTFLETLDYLAECSRVLKPGGVLVFDIYDSNLNNLKIVDSWLQSVHRFPVFLDAGLVIEFLKRYDLEMLSRLEMPYGASNVSYFMFKKR